MVLRAGLVLGLCAMWFGRGPVVDAYTSGEGSSAEMELSGIDLSVEPSPIEPSPFVVDHAPDTRDHQITLTPGDPGTLTPPEQAPEAGGEGEGTGLEPGSATVSGTVTGPAGEPVPLATVQIERRSESGPSVASEEVAADERGRWSLPDVAGGRYRVKAWLGEVQTSAGSEVLFVTEGEQVTVDLGVEPAAGSLGSVTEFLTFWDGGR